MAIVTLADVAARAGVSESTASRALSSARPVGREVAERVRLAAEELNYRGNSIARALRKSRTDTIGVVVPSILNPFFTALVDSLERASHAEGKQPLLCDSRQDPAIEAEQLRSLLDRQVDGIVISACDEVASVAALRSTARAVPLVQLDRRVEVEGTDWIGVDDDEAMRLVLEHLRSNGTRSAAFVSSEMTNSSTHLRLQGFLRHARRLGIEVRDEWTYLREYSIESGEAAGHALLRSGDRPQAVVCADDLIAIGVLRACEELNILVPSDVQVTGFDDITFAAYVTPGLTSLAQPTDKMASQALQLLKVAAAEPAARLGRGARVSFAPTLVVRGTSLQAHPGGDVCSKGDEPAPDPVLREALQR